MAPRVVDKEERRRSLLVAAKTAFTERGFAATTVEDVARRAGVSKGLLYAYFADKEDLLFSVLDADFAEALEQMETLTASRPNLDAIQTLRLAFGMMAGLLHEAETWVALSLEFWSAANVLESRQRFRDALNAQYATFRRWFAEVIRRGQAEGLFLPGLDAETEALVLAGVFDSVGLQVWLDPALIPPAELDDRVAAMGETFVRSWSVRAGASG